MKQTLTTLIFLLALHATAQKDWPNIGRYQKANEALGAPAKGERRVVFLGNSITEGWVSTDPAFFEGKPYIGRGISGQTTPQMLARFRQDVVNLKPAVVVLLAGINDIAQNTGYIPLEDTAGNIFSMAELAQANGIAVVLCSVLPASDFGWRPGMEPGPKVVALNRLIRAYAERNNIPYVDYYTPMTDGKLGLKKELGEDGVHPNLTGYKIMEPLVETAIARALRSKR